MSGRDEGEGRGEKREREKREEDYKKKKRKIAILPRAPRHDALFGTTERRSTVHVVIITTRASKSLRRRDAALTPVLLI